MYNIPQSFPVSAVTWNVWYCIRRPQAARDMPERPIPNRQRPRVPSSSPPPYPGPRGRPPLPARPPPYGPPRLPPRPRFPRPGPPRMGYGMPRTPFPPRYMPGRYWTVCADSIIDVPHHVYRRIACVHTVIIIRLSSVACMRQVRYEYSTDRRLASGVFRNLKRGCPGGTFQVYISKSVQILAYFFTLKLAQIFHLQGAQANHNCQS